MIVVHLESLSHPDFFSLVVPSQVASVTPVTSVARSINTTAAFRSTVTCTQSTVNQGIEQLARQKPRLEPELSGLYASLMKVSGSFRSI